MIDEVAADETTHSPAEPTLARELGLVQIILFGVGGIVGAGIYAIIGEAAAYGGSLLWLSFLIAAVVALMTAATYAELVSRFPDAGGSFEYVKRAFGLRFALGASIVMFFTGVVAAGAIAISFSSYLSRLLDLPQTLTTVAVISVMGLVNVGGAAQASWFNTLATAVTLVGLGAVVIVAAPDIGSVDLFDAQDTGLLGLGVGSALIFFSFIGFEDLVKLAEETREPEKTLPRGLLISGVIVLVIYLLVAVAAVSALGPDELSESSGPLAQIMDAEAGSGWATAIVVVALFATAKTVLSNIMGTSRLLFDVARDAGLSWLERLTRINDTTKTPIIAVVSVTAVAIAFGAIGNLRVVAAISNIAIMIVFITVNLALLRIRATSDVEPPFKIPLSIGAFPITALVAIVGTVALLALNVVALLGIGQ
ncbi:MAG: APC family permease [Ilumatobacter sp.]|uniref:APC family permease n=1 Tax=Ilumatobacter sp. TaxID=1967498 RepID=UPI003C793931